MAQTSFTLRARHACADPGFQRFHELLVRDRRRYPKEFWILPAMRRDDLSKHPESTGRTRAAPGQKSSDWRRVGAWIATRQFLGEVWVNERGQRISRPLTPRSSWLRGLDLNQRPLGYEGNAIRDRRRNVQTRNESDPQSGRRV